MARGRFISNKISVSGRVNDLPIPAALLYTWMITHLDVEGRMQGDARLIKQQVIPLKSYSSRVVEGWLKQMEESLDLETGFGLITRYEVAGRKYIWMAGFDSEQSNKGGSVWKGREHPSVLPPPPEKLLNLASAAGLINIPTERKAKTIDAGMNNPTYAAIVNIYESNIGILTPALAGKLAEISDKYPDGWFEKAVNIACDNNVRRLSYISKILERWGEQGHTENGKQLFVIIHCQPLSLF